MTPWSGNPAATPSAEFTLTKAPGGGPCAKSLAERPFTPTFTAATTSKQAGSFTAIDVDIMRADGNQELKGATVTLPPGLSAKLAGLTYCPAAALSAASASSGAAEAATSSCPAKSLVGSATIQAGSGRLPCKSAAARPSSQAPTTGRRYPWR